MVLRVRWNVPHRFTAKGEGRRGWSEGFSRVWPSSAVDWGDELYVQVVAVPERCRSLDQTGVSIDKRRIAWIHEIQLFFFYCIAIAANE